MEDEPRDPAPPATAATMPAAAAAAREQEAEDTDPDPIVATYTVYANPAPPTSRQLLVLQQPNRKLAREGPEDGLAIAEVRVKPRTGMLEVDVPVSHAHADYDREKGQRWGAALQRSVAAKNGGSHGLAGGFGVGVGVSSSSAAGGGRGGGAGGKGGGGRRGVNGEDLDMDLDWAEAVRQDKVLRTQTLGGQYPLQESSNCHWMIGVFQEGEFCSCC